MKRTPLGIVVVNLALLMATGTPADAQTQPPPTAGGAAPTEEGATTPSQPGSVPASPVGSEEAVQPQAPAAAAATPAAASAPPAEKKAQEDFELLEVSDEGIVFRDDSGEVQRVADFEQLSLEQLLAEKVVVTGGKRKQESGASLSTISVLNRDDIDALPYFFLGDLLATLPGLDVRWGKMQRVYVAARGLGGTALSSRMLLLWDGLPLNDPVTGELTAGHFLPLVDIERIEVIRGAGSTLYGSNAFSGVVNVITDSDKKSDLRASLTAGSFRTTRAQAAFREPAGSVQISGSAEAFRSDGPFAEVTRVRGTTTDSIKNDDVKSIALATSASYEGFRLAARYTYGERGRPGTFSVDSHGNLQECSTCHDATSQLGQGIKYPATTTSCGSCHTQPEDREEIHRGSVSASFNHSFSKNLQLSVNAYHNEWHTEYKTRRNTEFLGEGPFIFPETKQRATGAETHVSYSLGDMNTALLGGDFRRFDAASDILITPDGNEADQYEGAVFLEDEIKPLNWLAVTGGIRLDFNSRFSTAFTPRGGLVVTPVERLAIRGSVARAFRNPSFSELFVLDTRGRYAVFGNPDLKREWITSFEGGVTYTFTKPLVIRLSGTFFYNIGDNIISFRATDTDSATFFNIDDMTAVGGEGELEVQLQKNPQLKWFLNYSFQDVTDTEGEKLPYAPSSKLNTGLRFRKSAFAASVRLRYISKRDDNLGITLPGFTTIDAMARFDFWRGLGMELWAQNLADEIYQESLGIPAARRSFFVNLSYR